MTITIKDENHVPEILEQLSMLGRFKASAGIPAGNYSPGQSEGADLGTIAAVMEYGATIVPRPENTKQRLLVPDGNGGYVSLKMVTIPSRSYIRSTFEEKQGEWQQRAEKLVWQVATGDLTVEQAYNQLGAVMARDIQRKIKSHPAPENAPLTLANKSGGGTLIDTGRLWQAVTWKVEEI